MRGKHETPVSGDVVYGSLQRHRAGQLALAYADSGLGGSVRDLEQLAIALRMAGDSGSTERVDLRIVSLLEKKIYRKIMAQRRRNRGLSSGSAA
jgi:hypothetical protein